MQLLKAMPLFPRSGVTEPGEADATNIIHWFFNIISCHESKPPLGGHQWWIAICWVSLWTTDGNKLAFPVDVILFRQQKSTSIPQPAFGRCLFKLIA